MSDTKQSPIPEQFWCEARDIVFQKFSAIQMLDRQLDRAFNWPPDELVKETAMRLAAEAKITALEAQHQEHLKHVANFLSELYAVMVDPLDDSGLRVSEMTVVLLDAAKRDRQAAYDLRTRLDGAEEIMAKLQAKLTALDGWARVYENAKRSLDKVKATGDKELIAEWERTMENARKRSQRPGPKQTPPEALEGR